MSKNGVKMTGYLNFMYVCFNFSALMDLKFEIINGFISKAVL